MGQLFVVVTRDDVFTSLAPFMGQRRLAGKFYVTTVIMFFMRHSQSYSSDGSTGIESE
jgi:hypothetical protein